MKTRIDGFTGVGRRFGEEMRQHRERRGMSQRKLAAELARSDVTLDASAITRIERGQRDPKLSEVVAICAVLGIDLSSLNETATIRAFALTGISRSAMVEARRALVQALTATNDLYQVSPSEDQLYDFQAFHRVSTIREVVEQSLGQYEAEIATKQSLRKEVAVVDSLPTDLVERIIRDVVESVYVTDDAELQTRIDAAPEDVPVYWLRDA